MTKIWCFWFSIVFRYYRYQWKTPRRLSLPSWLAGGELAAAIVVAFVVVFFVAAPALETVTEFLIGDGVVGWRIAMIPQVEV